jgi:hypothetical protein
VVLRPSDLDRAVAGLIACGCHTEAVGILRVVREESPRKNDPYLQRLEGRVRLAQGDPISARPLLRASRDRFQAAGYCLDEAISDRLLTAAD